MVDKPSNKDAPADEPIALPLADRAQAGLLLASALTQYKGRHPVVLALPRGGVPVAHPIAQALDAPLDILLVRKLGAPGQRELAAGAIASGGVRVINTDVVEALSIPEETLDQIAALEQQELERRERAYRGARHRVGVGGRTVILVDDGVATGSTVRAAIAALRQLGPERIVVAVPVGAPDTIQLLRDEADAVVCLATPSPFAAIGYWYRNFDQVSDEQVRELLETARD